MTAGKFNCQFKRKYATILEIQMKLFFMLIDNPWTQHGNFNTVSSAVMIGVNSSQPRCEAGYFTLIMCFDSLISLFVHQQVRG